jgi:hypothetical protein
MRTMQGKDTMQCVQFHESGKRKGILGDDHFGASF